MTADRLLALYDRVADAPDAVSRLRQFVLDLAVRGKLVEQDPTDEPCVGFVEADHGHKGTTSEDWQYKEAKAINPD